MAHFYGSLQGARGEATRLGTKASGVTTYAAGWRGAIKVQVFEECGQDCYLVQLVPWEGSGGTTVVLAQGKLDARVPTPAMRYGQAGEVTDEQAFRKES